MCAYLLEVGVCLGPVPVNLGRVVCCIGKSGLRLGEGGFKLFSFGHDLCRSAVRPRDCVYDLSGAGAEISF
jgi:hypothetical protein